MSPDKMQRILDYWFEGSTDKTPLAPDSALARKWFKHDPRIDAEIRQKFEGDLIRVRKGKYENWLESPKGMLALIIVFDQFPRNIYRDDPKAFENDLKALELSLLAIKKKFDKKLECVERQFVYMPLMHAESLAVQKRSLEYFKELAEEAEDLAPQNIEYFKNNLRFAELHYDIIKRFNRFPHRNHILKRRSAPEEIEFLKGPGSSF